MVTCEMNSVWKNLFTKFLVNLVLLKKIIQKSDLPFGKSRDHVSMNYAIRPLLAESQVI